MTKKKKETYWLIVLICLIAVLFLILLWPSSKKGDNDRSDLTSELESTSDSLEDSVSDSTNETDSTLPNASDSTEDSISDSTNDSETNSASTAPVVSTDDWNLILVNRKHPLSEDFTVTTKAINDTHSVDERIYDALTQMLADARSEGLAPVVCSSFRTWEGQTKLFNNEFNDWLSLGYSEAEAYQLTSEVTAIPGTSEHQTGLAVDIVSNYNWNLNEEQEKTEEQQWLMAHCYEYGFILRFPNDKTEYTGIIYEPWHYRYVGVELATYLTENGLCLEEYLDSGTTIDPYTGE